MLQQPFHPALAEDDFPMAAGDFHLSDIDQRTSYFESTNIATALDRIEETILHSHRLPLTGKTMVNEEELLERLDTIRLNIPEALKAAQEILQYKHQIIAEAQQQAQQMLAEANQRAYQITNELGIIDRAEQEASQIRHMAITECEQIRQQAIVEVDRIRNHNIQEMERIRQVVHGECLEIQNGADEYADKTLHTMEYQLTDLLQTIQRGRHQLNVEAASLRNPQAEREFTSPGSKLAID
jgi:cell division septum initiation protein DivIVA